MDSFRYLPSKKCSAESLFQTTFQATKKQMARAWRSSSCQVAIGAITQFTVVALYPNSWEFKSCFLGLSYHILGWIVRIYDKPEIWIPFGKFPLLNCLYRGAIYLPSNGLCFEIHKLSGIKIRSGSQWWKLLHLKQINHIEITAEKHRKWNKTPFKISKYNIANQLMFTVYTTLGERDGGPVSPFATAGSRSAIVYLACREATQQNSPKKI